MNLSLHYNEKDKKIFFPSTTYRYMSHNAKIEIQKSIALKTEPLKYHILLLWLFSISLRFPSCYYVIIISRSGESKEATQKKKINK